MVLISLAFGNGPQTMPADYSAITQATQATTQEVA